VTRVGSYSTFQKQNYEVSSRKVQSLRDRKTFDYPNQRSSTMFIYCSDIKAVMHYKFVPLSQLTKLSTVTPGAFTTANSSEKTRSLALEVYLIS